MIKKIENLIDEKKNIFVTGAGGTGKSYILHQLKEKYPEMAITSTTGISAMNINGQTLHSWSGIGIGNSKISNLIEKITKQKKLYDAYNMENSRIERDTVYNKLKYTQWLAIDEISMLDGKLFQYLNDFLIQFRKDSRPFGGMNLILFGDFFQLPPVELSKNGYAFETDCWKSADFQPIILEKIYRQDDLNFITALNNARIGALTEADIKLFKSREIELNNNNDILHLFSVNNDSDNYNLQKLQKIDSELYTIKAIETGSQEDLEKLDKNCIAPKELNIKVGCKVMHLKNNYDLNLFNGEIGEVLEIGESIKVKFKDKTRNIEMASFDYIFKKNIDGIEKDVTVSRKQFPLKLAYGITMHKSQGMTLDNVRINLSRIFSTGQAYVALSRARTLDGLYILGFKPEKIFADKKIIEFYKNLKNSVSENKEPAQAKQKTVFDILQNQHDGIKELTEPRSAQFPRYAYDSVNGFKPKNKKAFDCEKTKPEYIFNNYDLKGNYIGDDLIGDDEIPF